MNTILLKRIVEAAENNEQRYNVGEEHGYLYTHKGDIKGAVIYGAIFALQNQWISVKEALPPLDDGMESVSIEVVVKNEYGKATCAWYSYITNTWHLSYGEIAGDDVIDSKITHWMHIPHLLK